MSGQESAIPQIISLHDKAKANGEVDKAKADGEASEALAYIQGVLDKKGSLDLTESDKFIRQAARLMPLNYALLREKMIKRLKVKRSDFDEMVDAARPAEQQSQKSTISEKVTNIFSQKDVETLLREFNEKFFVVENYGGKCRICWIDSDETLGRFISHQSFPDFHNRFQHRLVQIDVKKVAGVSVPVKKDHADIWLNHAERRQYTKVVFKPGETTPAEIYNLWQGFAYEPKQGDCDLYLNHVRDNICRGNEEHFKWLVNWMAYAVQHPNEQGHSAIVVFGKKGVGKNIMAESFSRLWGAHGMTVNDQKRVTGNFNNHLRDKTVLVCDEAFFAGDPRQDRVLKSLVTSDTITIESKGIDTVTVANLLRVIILGNDRQLVRLSSDERRYFVLECGDDQRNNQEYFGALKNQLEHNGGAGYSALLFHLLNVDLTGFNVRKPPHTDELREQMQESTTDGIGCCPRDFRYGSLAL